MQTGTKISGFLHLGAIGAALFGGILFKVNLPVALQVSNVSIMTTAEFEALQSSAPVTLPEVATAPAINEPESSQETVPDIAQPEVQTEPTIEPEKQVAMVAPSPVQALHIDTTSAPQPAPDAKEAETTQTETAPDVSAIQTTEPTQEQAPKETTTEIVTEAEKPSEYAPTTSSVPRSRPRDLTAPVAKVEKPKPVKEAPPDTTADEIAKALADVQTEARKPVGPPLTGGERDGLVLAVQKCWNVPIGLQNAADLAVVIEIELTQDGKLAKNPKLIEPSGPPTGTIKQAYEAGRRALIRCAPYDLPREKYEQWRIIEVVFNPEHMVVK